MAENQQMIYNSPLDDWQIPRATLEWYGLNLSTWSYLVFARIKKGTANDTLTMIVANYGALTNSNRGVAIIQVYASAGGAIAMTATQLAPCANSSTIKFGYYDGGDGYYYIGVYSPAYRDILSVIPLANPVRGGRRGTSFGDYYGSATAPDGWTAVNFT